MCVCVREREREAFVCSLSPCVPLSLSHSLSLSLSFSISLSLSCSLSRSQIKHTHARVRKVIKARQLTLRSAGAGKSTIIKLLSETLSPDDGEIKIDLGETIVCAQQTMPAACRDMTVEQFFASQFQAPAAYLLLTQYVIYY